MMMTLDAANYYHDAGLGGCGQMGEHPFHWQAAATPCDDYQMNAQHHRDCAWVDPCVQAASTTRTGNSKLKRMQRMQQSCKQPHAALFKSLSTSATSSHPQQCGDLYSESLTHAVHNGFEPESNANDVSDDDASGSEASFVCVSESDDSDTPFICEDTGKEEESRDYHQCTKASSGHASTNLSPRTPGSSLHHSSLRVVPSSLIGCTVGSPTSSFSSIARNRSTRGHARSASEKVIRTHSPHQAGPRGVQRRYTTDGSQWSGELHLVTTAACVSLHGSSSLSDLCKKCKSDRASTAPPPPPAAAAATQSNVSVVPHDVITSSGRRASVVNASVSTPAGSQQSGRSTAQVAASAAARVGRRNARSPPDSSIQPNAAVTGAVGSVGNQAAVSISSQRPNSGRSNDGVRSHEDGDQQEEQQVPVRQPKKLQGRLKRTPGITARAATAFCESLVQRSGSVTRQGSVDAANKAGVQRRFAPGASQQTPRPTTVAAAPTSSSAAATASAMSSSSDLLVRGQRSRSRASARMSDDIPPSITSKPGGLKSAMKTKTHGSSSENPSPRRVTFQAKNKVTVHVYSSCG